MDIVKPNYFGLDHFDVGTELGLEDLKMQTIFFYFISSTMQSSLAARSRSAF